MSQRTVYYSQQLKKPLYPIRPAAAGGGGCGPAPWLDKPAMLSVFARLTPHELATCALVCKAWADYSVSIVRIRPARGTDII